ncbi:sulfurtransferase [Litorihabitans aurantiacus]
MRLGLRRRVGAVGAEATGAAFGRVDPIGVHAGTPQESGPAAPPSRDPLRDAVFADVDVVHDLVWSAQAPVLLDVRWALGAGDGRAQYTRGHLPGAVFVDLETELAGPPSTGAGRHPLPDLADLQAAARRWGVGGDSTVLVYDDAGGTSAARAWWLLRWAGVADVRIVDGGLRAWVAAGHHLEDGDVRPRPGDVVLAPGRLPTVTADEVADHPGVVLDARDHARFTGEVEPVDPRAGHVPGEVSAPTRENLTPDGWLLEAEELRARFAGLGVPTAGGDRGDADGAAPDVAVYCGSGVTAAHQIAVLASIGVPAALYPGSFSQWSSDPDREVATGE